MSRVVWFDLEATGVDPYTDRIVEICMISDDGRELETRINPGVPIPAEASAVHGITDDDVRDAPTFGEIAGEVRALIDGAILAGYNSRRYDVPLLDAELERATGEGLPRDEWGFIAAPEIDLYQVWQQLEPRTLTSAARRFAGVELDDAHQAGADTRVLPDVLQGMIRELRIEPFDVARLVALSTPEGAVDRDGKFRRDRDEDGRIVFGFGKHEGRPAASQPGYLQWMLGADFPPETKAVARMILEGRVPAPAGG